MRTWLVVSVSTAGGAASLRVQVWRKLRSLGALYLQQSVCLLPATAPVVRDVRRLASRVRQGGGTARLLPDVLRLIRRLAADPDLPRGVRIRLGALLVYLALPVDLIPDFIPVLGYADDAIIVTAVLRSVVRRAGIGAVRAHWPGTDDGFAALARLTGLPGATQP
jgi:uncharacterized membrane protein YkvA (DUF1232 family)